MKSVSRFSKKLICDSNQMNQHLPQHRAPSQWCSLTHCNAPVSLSRSIDIVEIGMEVKSGPLSIPKETGRGPDLTPLAP